MEFPLTYLSYKGFLVWHHCERFGNDDVGIAFLHYLEKYKQSLGKKEWPEYDRCLICHWQPFLVFDYISISKHVQGLTLLIYDCFCHLSNRNVQAHSCLISWFIYASFYILYFHFFIVKTFLIWNKLFVLTTHRFVLSMLSVLVFILVPNC